MKAGNNNGTGDSCGTMTSDSTVTAAPTVPTATSSRPVAIPVHLRNHHGSSPKGSPGASSWGSNSSSSPRGYARRNLHKKTSNGVGNGSPSTLSPHGGSSIAANSNRVPLCDSSGSKNAGSTPQTIRKPLVLSNAAITDRYSPNGSPRNTTRNTTPANIKRPKTDRDSTTKSNVGGSNNDDNAVDLQSTQTQPEKKLRKSSSNGVRGGSDVSGAKRGHRLGNPSRVKETTVSITPAGASAKGCGSVGVVNAGADEKLASAASLPESIEISQRAKLDLLWKDRRIEQGMVRIPPNLLDDLIRKESIEKFYIVEETPVARNQLTNVTVKKITHRETGVTYAAKFSSRFRQAFPGSQFVDCSEEVLHEIAMLSVCTQSDKIVHLKDVFENRNEIILVLEYAPGGDFQALLDKDQVPFEQDVQRFLRQVAEGLQFMHELNIAHLDIKTENIVLMGEFPNCDIKLCDLEVARVIQPGESFTEWIGTLDYMAPELYNMEPVTLAADIWSFGVLAYALLSACLPFDGDTDTETIRNIQSQELEFPDALFEDVSEEAKEFIKLCLNRDPLKRPTITECLQHGWLAEEEEPPSPSPLMLKIPEPTFNKAHHHSDAGHRHGHGPGGHTLGVPLRGPRSCQTCRDKVTERRRYLSKSREAILEKATQSNLKKSLSKSRERLCDMRLTLSKSRDHLNAENIPKKLSKSQEKFYNFRSLSKSQEVLSASLTHAKKGTHVGAVSDMNHAQHMVTAIMNDTDNTLDLVLVPGGHILMSHPDLLRTNSGSLQMLPITESGRSTPGSISSIATVHDIQCANYGSILNPPDGCMGPGGVPGGLLASNIPCNPPAVVVQTPTASEQPQIEPLLEVSEEEELETKSNASEEHKDNESEKQSNNTRQQKLLDKEENSNKNKVQKSTDDKGKKPCSVTTSSGVTSKEEKETINYEKKQNMSRSASVDADIGRSAVSANDAKTTSTVKATSKNSGSSSSVGSKDTASIGIQVNLTKSVSSPNLMRKPNSREKVHEIMEVDIENELSNKILPSEEQKQQKISYRDKLVSGASKRSNVSSSTNKGDRKGSFTHDSMLGDGDIGDKPSYAWREELAKFQSQKPLRVSKLIGTFDKSGNEETPCDETNVSSTDIAALKRRRRGSLQIQLDEGMLKDLVDAKEEARKKEAKEKEQRRKSTSSILMRNIENLKIQDKISDILGHGHKCVTEEKAIEKTDVSEKLEEEQRQNRQNLDESQILKNADGKVRKNGNNNANIPNLNKNPKVPDKQKLEGFNKDKIISAAAISPKRTSSPYLDRKQIQTNNQEKKKNWDYFEINHPKAISDKKLQELKAKYQRRKTEDNMILKRDRKVSSTIKEEKESEDTYTTGKNSSSMGSNTTRQTAALATSAVSRNITSKEIKNQHQRRCNSVPGIQTTPSNEKLKDKSVNLDLSIDPLTGECLASRTETAILAHIKEDASNADYNKSKEGVNVDDPNTSSGNLLTVSSGVNSSGVVNMRKQSSEEESGNSSSRRSSRSSRRRSSHLSDIQEQYIPEEKVLEVRIDPLTGQVETVEVYRSKSAPITSSITSPSFNEHAVNLTSTQSKETNSTSQLQEFDQEKRRKLSVDINKATPSSKQLKDQQDDGIGSLPNTPTDLYLERPPRLSVLQMDDNMSFSSSEEGFDRLGQLLREQREASTGTSGSGSVSQYQTILLDGGYGADSISSWDESSSVAQDDECDDLQSRPASAQPSIATSTMTVKTSSGNVSSVPTSSSTSLNSQVNKTCTGAFSRAMERFNNKNQPSTTTGNTPSSTMNSDTGVNTSSEENDCDKEGTSDICNNPVMRRQSSPMVRPSSS